MKNKAKLVGITAGTCLVTRVAGLKRIDFYPVETHKALEKLIW